MLSVWPCANFDERAQCLLDDFQLAAKKDLTGGVVATLMRGAVARLNVDSSALQLRQSLEVDALQVAEDVANIVHIVQCWVQDLDPVHPV